MVPLDWLPAAPTLRPRMKMLPWPGPLDATETLGRYRTKSSKVVTLSCFSVSAVSAWIVMGTFCTFSVRRCAVTVISWIESEASVSVAVAAWANPPAEPLKIAAIA